MSQDIMAPALSTFEQLALWNDTRQPALYGSLIALLVVNNVVAGGRFLAHYRTHYRHNWGFRVIFAEDYLILLSALCINAVIGNLLAGTYEYLESLLFAADLSSYPLWTRPPLLAHQR